VIIAAGMTNKPIFATAIDQKLKAYAFKLLWAKETFSDCFAILHAYETWKAKKDTKFFKRKTQSVKGKKMSRLGMEGTAIVPNRDKCCERHVRKKACEFLKENSYWYFKKKS
jgi:hypothetical protein